MVASFESSKVKKMTTKQTQVAVVGAGTSGLMAIKALKEEGFEPYCFEKSSYFGGLWQYHEEDVNGVPSVMSSTSLNNSKELGALSDFPPRPEFPNYMKHFTVLKMFTEYGEKFDLFRHIKYNQEVISIRRTEDHDETGKWNVAVKDVKTNEVAEDVFDAVMVCIGHLSIPDIPTFPGMSQFRGEIIHTHSIKKFHEFDGKRACVVGMGSSALDAAVEISHVGSQVYLSARTPTWVCTRHGPYGYPLDWAVYTWDHNVLHKIFPLSWSNKFAEEVFLNPRFSHRLYNIHPTRGVSNRDFAVNDSLSDRIMNGTIIMKKDIERFTENGVVFFDDEDQETEVDVVVLGTGYKWEFPFLDHKDFITQGSKLHLYKCVYPPHLPFPTLGIIGFVVPLGPGFPCIEMQCRWFAHNLTGKSKLPDKHMMLKSIDKQYLENIKRYGPSSRVYLHVDFMPYVEDLASSIGVCPNMLKLLFTDFELFTACAIGPYIPYRFRLSGPHHWNGARKAILEAGQRMRAPLQGKNALVKKQKSSRLYYILACLSVISYYFRNELFQYENILVIQNAVYFLKDALVRYLKTWSLTSKFML